MWGWPTSFISLTQNYGAFSLLGQSWLSISVNLIIVLALMYLMVVFVLMVKNSITQFRQQLVCLELMPPGFRDFSSIDYENLFNSVYGLQSTRSFKDRLLRKKPTLSFEVVADKHSGVRFMAVMSLPLVDNFKRQVRHNIPGTIIKPATDYLVANQNLSLKVLEFKQKQAFYLPLKEAPDANLVYMSSLGSLNGNESLVFQIIVSPLSFGYNKRAKNRLSASASKPGWLIRYIRSLNRLVKLILGRKAPKKDTFDSKSKLDSPLFKSNLRLVVSGSSYQEVNNRVGLFKASLAKLAYPAEQSLVARFSLPNKVLLILFRHRLLRPMAKPNPVLSSMELASLYCFPNLSSPGSQDISKNLSRTLPVDKSFKTFESKGVILGQNSHDDEVSPIILSDEERARHVYLIGGTGNGKTTMLEYMIHQDINNYKGVMVIDPHGDLAKNILKNVPKKRIKDVIYLNPSDIDYPIPINLLEIPDGLGPGQLMIEKDHVTESVLSVLRKTFEQSDDSSAYRIERLLRNAVLTALTLEGATLFTVSRILSDKYYRWNVIQKLNDESLRRFWLEEFNKAGDYQRIKMTLGPLARLERFERNSYLKSILSQPKSGFDLDKVMSTGKIVICNLAKGSIGEDTSSVLGAVLLAKLQLAALRRESLPETKRRPFYVYVDEFQQYANSSFVNMFSEARKYGLHLTMAQQSPAQLSDKNLLNVIMDNIGTLVAFRSKSWLSEKLILSQFSPYIGKQEISNLPRHYFYAKVAATDPKPPVSGATILVEPSKKDASKDVIHSSRRQYAPDLQATSRPALV